MKIDYEMKENLVALQYFYDCMPQKFRNHLLWDLPGNKKFETLCRINRIADLHMLAAVNGRPVAYAWLIPVSRQGQSAEVHFAASQCDVDVLELAGRHFFQIADCFYNDYVAMLPAAYRPEIALAEKLGFAEVCRLRKACYLEYRNKHTDGVVMVRSARHPQESI